MQVGKNAVQSQHTGNQSEGEIHVGLWKPTEYKKIADRWSQRPVRWKTSAKHLGALEMEDAGPAVNISTECGTSWRRTPPDDRRKIGGRKQAETQGSVIPSEPWENLLARHQQSYLRWGF